MEQNRKVYSVGEVTNWIRQVLGTGIPPLWIRGELQECNAHASTMYMVLKDSSSQIRLVYFQGMETCRNLGIEPGMEVEVFGSVVIYDKQSSYQIRVSRIQPVGQGSLYQQYQEMRNRLYLEGLFLPEHKKPIPRLPKIIGVVTSAEGAAIKDFLKTLFLHHSGVHVRIFPTAVQGTEAAAQIAWNILYASYYRLCDVLVVTRGGGSLEDLWPYNEEQVARAIFQCDIPVISAVGHEKDFTIADEVADLRCATPTAAANRVIEEKQHLAQFLEVSCQRMQNALRLRLEAARHRFEQASGSYVLRQPENMVCDRQQYLDQLLQRLVACLPLQAQRAALRVQQGRSRLLMALPRMTEAVSRRFAAAAGRLRSSAFSLLPVRQGRAAQAYAALVRLSQEEIERRKRRLETLTESLRMLDPKGVLQRGYAILSRPQGEIVRSPEGLLPGEKLKARVRDGEFTVVVKQ